MILIFIHCKPIKILKIIMISLLLFLFISINSPPQINAMKIHPLSTKRNITTFLNTNSPIDQTAPRKLRRLPHVFAAVLELPFPSHADVTIQDTPDSLKFLAGIENFHFSGAGESVRAHAVEIFPGITKVVIGIGEIGDLGLVDDVWRYRLPAVARPELATAVFLNGEIVVTVPKSGDFRVLRNGNNNGAFPRLLVVQ